MSRSKKKNPVVWYACHSNKQGKRQCNKRFRRIVHQRLYTDYHLPTHVREVMDEWTMPADGKHRLIPGMHYYEKSFRK